MSLYILNENIITDFYSPAINFIIFATIFCGIVIILSVLFLIGLFLSIYIGKVTTQLKYKLAINALMFINFLLPVRLFMCSNHYYHAYTILLGLTCVISLILFRGISDRSFPSTTECIRLFIYTLIISELFYIGKPYLVTGFFLVLTAFFDYLVLADLLVYGMDISKLLNPTSPVNSSESTSGEPSSNDGHGGRIIQIILAYLKLILPLMLIWPIH